jgi:tetratricopeptide (TPR) repeat protein
MPLRQYWEAGITVVLGSLLLAGCGVASARKSTAAQAAPVRQSAKSTQAARAKSPAPASGQLSPEAREQRTEAQARYALGILHDLADQPEQANEEFYQAALDDPTNEHLVLEVTHRLILQSKQFDKAAGLLVKATAQPNASGLLFAQLGLVYSFLGQQEQAIAASRQAIAKMPAAIAGYQNLARVYLQTGRNQAGIKVLDEAAQVPGVEAAFLVDLSELYTAFARAGALTNRTTNSPALALLNRAAQLKPANPLVLLKLADGFTVLNEGRKAAELYGQLLERFPKLPGLREKLAEIYLRQKDSPKAAEQLQAIIRQNPTNPQAYYLLGSLAFDAHKMEDAAENYRKTLLLNSAFEPAYYDLALAQINLKQSREALQTLQKAQEKFPQKFTGEFFSGLACASLKEYSNAVHHLIAAEVIGRATETNRLTHYFYFQLGAAYERNGQLEEAEVNLKKALQLAPDFAEALNYLGYSWADRGVHLPEARQMIEKALKLEPKNAAYLDSLAWVFYKLNQPQDALAFQLQAVELSKEPDGTLYDHLGDIYAALHQRDKALEAWRKALALEPNPEIEKKLQPVAGGAPPVRQP